jgi:hypothetical protein
MSFIAALDDILVSPVELKDTALKLIELPLHESVQLMVVGAW